MKKIFYPLFIALAAVPFALHAAQTVSTSAPVSRAQDMQLTFDGKTKAVSRGDLLGDGAVLKGNGFVLAQAFPGVSFRLAGDAKPAFFALNKNSMAVENGYVTQQNSNMSLNVGRLFLKASRAPQGVASEVAVGTDYGVARPETVESLMTTLGVIRRGNNVIVACYAGTGYFTYNDGVPNFWNSTGTKSGERKVVIVIPARMVFNMEEFNEQGNLVPLDDAVARDSSLTPPEDLGDTNGPVNDPPVVISPSGL